MKFTNPLFAIRKFYLTGSYERRALFIFFVICLPPLFAIPVINEVNDEINTPEINRGEITKVKVELTLINQNRYLDVQSPGWGYIWQVENVWGGPSQQYLIYGTSDMLSIYDEGDVLWVKVQEKSQLPLRNVDLINHPDHNPQGLSVFEAKEVKGLIFWNYQLVVLVIFYLTALIMRNKLNSLFNKIMRVDEYTNYESLESDIFVLYACTQCGGAIEFGQNLCHTRNHPTSSCVICLQKPLRAEYLSILICCSNYVHSDHIRKWFSYNRQCPACTQKYPQVKKIATVLHS